MKQPGEEKLELTEQNGDEGKLGTEELGVDSPLSWGTDEHPQPALVLVLEPSVTPQKVEQIASYLSTLHISSFSERSADHAFLCLHLSRDQCEELAHKHSYHVPFMCRKSSNRPDSWRAKFVSICSYGTLSYQNFTKMYYTVMYHKKLKSKIEPEFTKSLYSVRVQAELINASLRAEKVFEVEDFKIVSNFVPHTPEMVELERKLSWFPPLFPLREFRDYFGEELAFVYAWSNFWWTFGLLPLALVSMLTLLYGLGTELDSSSSTNETDEFWHVLSRVMLNPSVDYYVGFLVIWISVFQYQWSKAAPIFSLQWGVENFNKEEEMNVSPREKKWRKYVKLPTLLISLGGFVIAAALTCVLFLLTEVVLRVQLNKLDFGVLQRDWKKKIINKTAVISFLCSMFYTILNHLLGHFFIPWFSNVLTTLEKHKFQSYFNSSVIFKHTGYYLMSSYFYLVYVVFRINVVISEEFDLDVDATKECTHNGICMITITQQLIIQILELRLAGAFLFLLTKLIAWIRQKNAPVSAKSHDLQYILQNYKSLKFLSSAETSTWMTERVLMYGYLTLFSYHLPLVSLIALVLEAFITYYEMRMLLRSQRPQPRRVGNIKQWEGIIYLLNIMCVVINSYSINQRILYSHMENIEPNNPNNARQLIGQQGSNVPFFFLPLFIFITSLIHIQDAVSGDKVQCHVHNQYSQAVRLLADYVVEVDGVMTTCL